MTGKVRASECGRIRAADRYPGLLAFFMLISMSDEELWELARLTTSGGEAVEVVYERYKDQVRRLRGTAGEWVVDTVRPAHGRHLEQNVAAVRGRGQGSVGLVKMGGNR